MIFKKIKQILVFTMLLVSGFIYSKIIYVAINGNDSNNGSINSLYKTFSKAISVMSAGDICIIRGGTYEQQLFINKNGTHFI